MLTLSAAATFWAAPLVYVHGRAARRLDLIERQVPDLIDMLVVTLEAGLGFGASMDVASSRLRAPIGSEIRLTMQEQSMGLGMSEALTNMLARVDTYNMSAFVRSVVQGNALGVSMGIVMRNLAVDMRVQAAPAGRGTGPQGAGQDALPADLPDVPGARRRHPRAGDLRDHRDAGRCAVSGLQAWANPDLPAPADVEPEPAPAPAPVEEGAPAPRAEERPDPVALAALLDGDTGLEGPEYLLGRAGAAELRRRRRRARRRSRRPGRSRTGSSAPTASPTAASSRRATGSSTASSPERTSRSGAPEEKHAIADAFGSLASDDDRNDIDHTLYTVRVRLEELVARGELELPGGVDYYRLPLRETWDAGELGRAASGLSHLDALRHKKQVVLYGPPGTGKTFEAKALADRLIRNEAIRRWGPVEYLRNRERVSELVRRQVRRRQLHQAYSYEDFMIGLRVAENGETEPYRGDLLQLIDEIRQSRVTSMDAEPLPWVLVLDEINRTDLSRLLGEAFSALDDRDAQIELPAVGGHAVDPFKLPDDLYFIGTMNTIDQSVEQLDFAMRRRFFWLHSGFRRHVIPTVLRDRWEALAGNSRPWLARHTWEAFEPDVEQLASRAAALNRAIAESPLLGTHYEIGHTYFFDVVGFVADQPGCAAARRLRATTCGPPTAGRRRR